MNISANQRFGSWVVLLPKSNESGRWKSLCRCDCGTVKEVVAYALTKGKTTSCGCKMAELVAKSKIKHGKCGTVEYKRWADMKSRCNRPSHISYPNYGGRGIKVCQRWDLFENFLEDMGLIPDPAWTLDRIDSNGDYCPENCRWETYEVQQNNRRSNHRLDFQGRSQTIAEWAREFNLNAGLVSGRLALGWSVEDTLTVPVSTPVTATYKGKTQTLRAWERELGFGREVLRSRLETGWSVEEAFETPSGFLPYRRSIPLARDKITGQFLPRR